MDVYGMGAWCKVFQRKIKSRSNPDEMVKIDIPDWCPLERYEPEPPKEVSTEKKPRNIEL